MGDTTNAQCNQWKSNANVDLPRRWWGKHPYHQTPVPSRHRYGPRPTVTKAFHADCSSGHVHTHLVHTWANTVKFGHQAMCNPKIFSILIALGKGFLKGCPNLSKELVTKYLNPSPAMAKRHMKRPKKGKRSTIKKAKTKGDDIQPVPLQYPKLHRLFCQSIMKNRSPIPGQHTMQGWKVSTSSRKMKRSQIYFILVPSSIKSAVSSTMT